MKRQAARGSTAKHAGSRKHAGAAKHHPTRQPAGGKGAPGGKAHTVAKHPAHAKARQLSPGDVACCSAEALAASLRLQGRTVGADDVLALYWHTAHGPDAGASILATLQAASEFGLAGLKPLGFAPLEWDGARQALERCLPVEGCREVIGQSGKAEAARHDPCRCATLDEPAACLDAPLPVAHGLILGLETPDGAHAVCAEPRGWWSWGGLHEFPGAAVEEAWAVVWP
jgi:hypothetical protein